MLLHLKQSAKLLAMAAVMVLFASSCKKVTEDASVELSHSKLEVSSAISQTNFTVTTTGEWTAQSSESWCVLTPATGSGKAIIKVDITSANTTTTARTAIVTVSVGGNSKQLEVVQNGFKNIQTSKSGVELLYNQLAASVDVTASAEWEILPTSLPEWIETEQTSGVAGSTTVNFTVDQNDDDAVREAVVKFKLKAQNDTASFRVLQYTIRGNGRQSDSLALVAIFKCIDQPAHEQHFDFTKPISLWRGVTLARVGLEYRVVSLNLANTAIYTVQGSCEDDDMSCEYYSCWRPNTPLPEDIGYLEYLVKLNCSSQPMPVSERTPLNITGPIPENIGKLTRLKELVMYDNKFNGEIPSSIKNLVRLQKLRLSNNMLSGDLPVALGDLVGVDTLELDGNRLRITDIFPKMQALRLLNFARQGEYDPTTGTYKLAVENTFPSSLLQLKGLTELTINDCNMIGSLPANIGSMASLWYLKAYNNKLTGTIPTKMGEIEKLAIVNLSNNQLEGEIPATLGNCAWLQFFVVSNNKLTGTVPDALGKCSLMGYFDVSNNQLTGTITDQLVRGANLSYFAVNNNKFSGEIPAALGNHTALNYLNISDNTFTAINKDVFGGMLSLKQLYAANNQLTEFPAEMSSLLKVDTCDFSGNNLTGVISNEVGQMYSLLTLKLNNNRLSGAIPTNLLTHHNAKKFNWQTDICPQQSGYSFTNCPAANGVKASATKVRRR